MIRAALACLLLVGAAPAHSADDPADPGGPDVDAAITSWLELDTNARRLPSGPLDGARSATWKPPSAGDDSDVPTSDGLVRTTAQLAATLRRPGFFARTDNAAGLKLFVNAASERMLVLQSRGLAVVSGLPAELSLSTQGLAKTRLQQSGARSYGLLRGDVLVSSPLLPGLTLRAGVGGQRFDAYDAPLFSSFGGSFLGGARAANDNEALDVVVESGVRSFPAAPRRLDDPTDRARRTDTITSSTVQASSARRVFLTGAWTATRNQSNARGESWTRHRLSAAVGFRLPAEVTVTAQGAVQLTAYDDGVSIGQLYFLGDDEESQNVVEVMLARPLWGGLFFEGRLSFMGNELAVEGARFSRHTAAFGLRAEL